MRVAVVDIREMRMPMDDRLVCMQMRVRFGAIPSGGMLVTMVLVVRVRVFVRDRLVHVFMLVVFRNVQPDTQRHHCTGHGKLQRHRIMLNQERQRGAKKWRNREVRAGARGSQVPQRENEQNQTDAVAQKTDERGSGHDDDRWQWKSERQRTREGDAPGDQPFQPGDNDGIIRRDFAGQVVVDGPEHARGGDQ